MKKLFQKNRGGVGSDPPPPGGGGLMPWRRPVQTLFFHRWTRHTAQLPGQWSLVCSSSSSRSDVQNVFLPARESELLRDAGPCPAPSLLSTTQHHVQILFTALGPGSTDELQARQSRTETGPTRRAAAPALHAPVFSERSFSDMQRCRIPAGRRDGLGVLSASDAQITDASAALHQTVL